jgi:hypothetical protein
MITKGELEIFLRQQLEKKLKVIEKIIDDGIKELHIDGAGNISFSFSSNLTEDKISPLIDRYRENGWVVDCKAVECGSVYLYELRINLKENGLTEEEG